jgi:hypothetical protein
MGGDLPVMDVVKNYIRSGELVEDLPTGKTVKEHYGVAISLLINQHDNNFKKPISQRTSRIMVTFKVEHLYHNSGNCFPINWKICIS